MQTCDYVAGMESYAKRVGSMLMGLMRAGKYSASWPAMNDFCSSARPKTVFMDIDHNDARMIGDALGEGLAMLEYFRDNKEVSIGIDEVKDVRWALAGVLSAMRYLSFVYDYGLPVKGDDGGRRIYEMQDFREFKDRWDRFRADMECVELTSKVKVEAKSDWENPDATHIYVEISDSRSVNRAEYRRHSTEVSLDVPRIHTRSFPDDEPQVREQPDDPAARYEDTLLSFLDNVLDQPGEDQVGQFVKIGDYGVTHHPDILRKHKKRIVAAEGALLPYYVHRIGSEVCQIRNREEAEFRNLTEELNGVLSAVA